MLLLKKCFSRLVFHNFKMISDGVPYCTNFSIIKILFLGFRGYRFFFILVNLFYFGHVLPTIARLTNV